MKKAKRMLAFSHRRSIYKLLLLMKFTTTLLLFATLHVSAKSFSQDRITLKLQSAELKTALQQIEKKSAYRFLYNDDVISSRRKVNIDADNALVTDVLNGILNETTLTYKVLENNLVVITQKTLVVQDTRVSGKVSGPDGQGIPSVTVRIKNSNVATTTDAAGNYSISVPDGATLVFSSVGYTTTEMPVNGRTELNVVLQIAAKDINEVVVVGYGTQRKVDITSSIAQIKGEEIAKQSSFNPLSALQGKVAGVQITNAGAPGAAPQITIRGVGTVYGSTNPLYVVDGVWFDDINFLNSNDIENISILKDAAAESIYGIRAANGVILVTTKKGRQNARAVTNYNGYVGTQVVTNQIKMVDGSEYAELINEVDALAGAPGRYADPSAFGTTDWYHQILRRAMVNSHQVSVTGGGDKSSYNFSLGYYQQGGLVENNDFKRYTVHIFNEQQLAQFIKVGVNVTGSMSKSNDVPGSIFSNIFNAAPIVPVYYADGAYGDPGDFNIASANLKNPQVELDLFDQQTKTWKLNGSVYADLKFLKNFTFHTSAGGDFEQAEINNYIPYSNYLYMPVAYRATHSTLTKTRRENRNWIIENTLTYDKRFGDHSIKVLVGQGAQESRYYKLVASAFDVPSNSELRYFSLGTASTRTISDFDENDKPIRNRVNSYFGRVNYSFQDKYLLTASLRADGSSVFSNNWGYLPSVGLGWVISKEKFMQDQRLFDNLKLRGSWGKIGNTNVPAHLSVLTVAQTPDLIYVGGDGSTATGASINSVVTPSTDWELGVGTDIGIEASLLNNKLYAEIDWYNRKTQNAIFDIPVLGSVGTSSGAIIGNQATFQNQGFEFLVTWKDNINKDWSYSISANAGLNKNKVLKVASGGTPIYQYLGTSVISRSVVGEPIGQFYGRQVIGIFQSAADIANYKDSKGDVIQPDAKPGDFKYRDVNDDGAIDGKDRVILGNPNPRAIFGINTTLTYRNFDLTLDLQGVKGIEIYNGNFALRFGSENYTQDFYDNRWHGEGTSNVYPSVAISGNNSEVNSFFVEDGSYFRIRNAQLGYTVFGSNGAKRYGISKLRVYVNAQNPVTWFHYRGFTPEVPAGSPTKQGIDQQVNPLYATYNFGVNLTF